MVIEVNMEDTLPTEYDPNIQLFKDRTYVVKEDTKWTYEQLVALSANNPLVLFSDKFGGNLAYLDKGELMVLTDMVPVDSKQTDDAAITDSTLSVSFTMSEWQSEAAVVAAQKALTTMVETGTGWELIRFLVDVKRGMNTHYKPNNDGEFHVRHNDRVFVVKSEPHIFEPLANSANSYSIREVGNTDVVKYINYHTNWALKENNKPVVYADMIESVVGYITGGLVYPTLAGMGL